MTRNLFKRIGKLKVHVCLEQTLNSKKDLTMKQDGYKIVHETLVVVEKGIQKAMRQQLGKAKQYIKATGKAKKIARSKLGDNVSQMTYKMRKNPEAVREPAVKFFKKTIVPASTKVGGSGVLKGKGTNKAVRGKITKINKMVKKGK